MDVDANPSRHHRHLTGLEVVGIQIQDYLTLPEPRVLNQLRMIASTTETPGLHRLYYHVAILPRDE